MPFQIFNKLAVSTAAALLVMGFSSTTLAQSSTIHKKPPHKNFIHRHPNAASAAVGYGTYRYAKSRHHGFMHKHPVLTGAAAAGLAHHHLKKKK